VDQYRAAKLWQLVGQGKAMPTPDTDPRPARFPIANRDDLERAIRAVGRVRPNTDEARAKVRRHIIEQAARLKLSQLIPPNWAADGSLKS
jgi:hypothetical protein